MAAMHQANKRIDLTLLVDALKKSGDYEAIGGAAFLAKVAQSVPHAAHAEYYATVVREKATYRSLIQASTAILGQRGSAFLEFLRLVGGMQESLGGAVEVRPMGAW